MAGFIESSTRFPLSSPFPRAFLLIRPHFIASSSAGDDGEICSRQARWGGVEVVVMQRSFQVSLSYLWTVTKFKWLNDTLRIVFFVS